MAWAGDHEKEKNTARETLTKHKRFIIKYFIPLHLQIVFPSGAANEPLFFCISCNISISESKDSIELPLKCIPYLFSDMNTNLHPGTLPQQGQQETSPLWTRLMAAKNHKKRG
jgi:hypothetical protein